MEIIDWVSVFEIQQHLVHNFKDIAAWLTY